MSTLPRSPRLRATRISAPVIAGLLALASAACDGLLSPSERPQDQILFLRHADATDTNVWHTWQTDIYRMNEDGTGVENLTAAPARYGGLSLSPDGRKVLFGSVVSFTSQVWVMNTDGSGRRQLTTTGQSSAPRWSPDGTRIAYHHYGPDDGVHVYVMNADGSNPRNVSLPAMDGGCSPTSTHTRIELVGWLPDGRVAFSRFICGGEGYRFYTVNADGSGFARTDFDLNDAYWSPDGSKVAFIGWEGSLRKLFIMNADGSGVRRLTDHGVYQALPPRDLPHFRSDYTPWSPDGRRIVFYSEPDSRPIRDCWGSALPYVINADGTGLTLLKDFCGEFNGWSPEGDRVMFTSWKDGARDVYTVRPDGTGLVKVTSSPVPLSSAMWVRGR